MDASFESVRKLCGWAREEIAAFDEAAVGAVRHHNPDVVNYYDRELGCRVFYPAYDQKIPPGFERLEKSAYRIVGDVRAILDQACHTASVLIGSANEDKTNFPLANDEIDLMRRLENPKGNFAGIPEILHPLIISFEPFMRYRDGREGSAVLRTIGKIANPNKHKVPLKVGFKYNGLTIGNCPNLRVVVNPEKRRSRADRPEAHLFPIEDGEWRFSGHFKQQVRLADAGLFSNSEATKAFHQMLSAAESIVGALENFTVHHKDNGTA